MHASSKTLAEVLILSAAMMGTASAPDCQEDEGIRRGSRVRILVRQPRPTLLLPNGWLQATLVSVTPDSFQVVQQGTEDTLTISVASVARAQLPRGRASNAGTGAIVGGIIGVSLGVGFGLYAASELEDSTPGNVVAIGVLFGFGGAILGAGVGAVVKTDRWVDVPPPWAEASSPNGRIAPSLACTWSW